MEKIKTLNDFLLIDCKCCKVGDFGREISNLPIDAWEVRQEAIKWYKHYKKIMNYSYIPIRLLSGITIYNASNYQAKMEFIKEFFNLTEEDLQEKKILKT